MHTHAVQIARVRLRDRCGEAELELELVTLEG